MSKEESVEVVPRAIRKLPTTDHTGRQFGTILDMVRHWGISYGIFYDRYAKRGLDFRRNPDHASCF